MTYILLGSCRDFPFDVCCFPLKGPILVCLTYTQDVIKIFKLHCPFLYIPICSFLNISDIHCSCYRDTEGF